MGETVTKSIIVKGRLGKIYDAWADFESFPNFMKNVKSVTRMGESLSHWVMDGPLGKTVEWDAEITRKERNKRIAWSSKDGSPVKTSGQVTFKELPNKEVEITATLHVEPSGGAGGDAIVRLFGNLPQWLDEDLRNFKAYVEGMPSRVHAD